MLKKILILVSIILLGASLSDSVLAKSQCSGLSNSSCSKNNTCTWRKASVDKNGKKTKAHCRALPGKAKTQSKSKSSTSKSTNSKSSYSTKNESSKSKSKSSDKLKSKAKSTKDKAKKKAKSKNKGSQTTLTFCINKQELIVSPLAQFRPRFWLNHRS